MLLSGAESKAIPSNSYVNPVLSAIIVLNLFGVVSYAGSNFSITFSSPTFVVPEIKSYVFEIS